MDSDDEADPDLCSHYSDYQVRAELGFHDHATEAAELLNNILSSHVPPGVSWTLSKIHWTFELTDLTVEIQNEYGLTVVAMSNLLPRKILDTLRLDLRAILHTAISGLFWNTMVFAVMLLQLAEEANICLQEFKRPRQGVPIQQGWDAATVVRWEHVLGNPHGVDLLTVNDTAKYILGQSITDICKEFPKKLRILHVEPVFRADLVSRFLQRRLDLKTELMSVPYNQLRKSVTKKQIHSGEVVDSQDGIAEYLCTPRITFHGAPRHVVSSIVRYGFLIPGQQIGKTGTQVSMSSGAFFGVGIYSSPSIEFASFYGRWSPGSGEDLDFFNPSQVPGFRMIVCATLMGRSIQVSHEEAYLTSKILKDGAHSQISPNGLEYIIFDKTQIIPCYVLHVDYGSDDTRAYINDLLKEPRKIGRSHAEPRLEADSFEGADFTCPGAIKARKEALKAAAKKWFPYGYGPSTGTNFIIEEIGNISDDEEDFGEFQAMRGEQQHEIQTLYQRKDEKISWFDEYQYVRNTNKEVYGDTRHNKDL